MINNVDYVVAAAVITAGAVAPTARAAAQVKSARQSSADGAIASTSARAGGSSQLCVTHLGTRTTVRFYK